MTNAQIIHSYEDALYEVKRGFLIIGLTGYTGSGCSTARNILDSPYKPVTPSYNDLNKAGFENELEHRKLTHVWDKIKWNRFVPIDFSCVVFAFAMRKAILGTNRGQKNPLTELRKLGKSHHEKLKGLKLLTDEKKNDGNSERLSDKNLKSQENAQLLIDAYKCTSKLYKEYRDTEKPHKFTKNMQNWGDEIRQYGEVQPTGNKKDPVHPEFIACLPEAVRRIMKSYQTIGSKKFCIDAFRNPYEVEYFRRRYSEFYLVHLNRSPEHRRSALTQLPHFGFCRRWKGAETLGF
jgi:hypothetical protein